MIAGLTLGCCKNLSKLFPESQLIGEPEQYFAGETDFFISLVWLTFHKTKEPECKDWPPWRSDVAIGTLRGICFRIVKEKFLDNAPADTRGLLARA